MSLFEPRSGPSDLFRPFLWLALFAFLIGFSGYLAVGARQLAASHERLTIPVAAPSMAAPDPVRTT